MGRKPSARGQRAACKISSEAPRSPRIGPLVGSTGVICLVLAAIWQWWSHRDGASLKKLRNQLQLMGGSVDCAKGSVFEYHNGFQIRGLMATCDFVPGAQLAALPRAAVLSDDTIDQKVLDLVADEMDASPHDDSGFVSARDIALAAGLLHEKTLRRKSNFAEHIASLPTKATVPQNLPQWDEIQLSALSIVHWDVVIRVRTMVKHVMAIVMANSALFGRPTEEDCTWALAIVISRQVHGRLIPFLDQANHASKPNSKLSCDQRGCQLTATQTGLKGEELTITYGNKPNLNLLLAYGFVMPNNSVSALSLDFSGLNITDTHCPGSKATLDHKAPLAVNAATLACFETAMGRCALVEALLSRCEQLSKRFSPQSNGPSYLSRAMGKADATIALAALEARRPQKTIDETLARVLREELRVVERCVNETRAELDALAAQGACNTVLK